MINKISDNTIRETTIEETTQPQEPQTQSNIAPEAEPLVQATPEHKSGLIAEQRLGGQAQELLLRDQLNSQTSSADSNKASVQNDVRQPTFTREPDPTLTKSPLEIVRDTAKQIPGQLKSTLGAIGEAWSDPIGVISDATDEAKRKLDNIKDGK